MASQSAAKNPVTITDWKPEPQAQALLNDIVQEFLVNCSAAAGLALRMLHETGTRFVDWIDHIQAARTDEIEQRLRGAGFVRRAMPGAPHCFAHDGAMFPPIVLSADLPMTRIAIKADSVVDFLAAHGVADDNAIQGGPMAKFRRAPVFRSRGAELWVVERHGYRGFAVEDPDPAEAVATLRHREALRRRSRDLADDAHGYEHLNVLLDDAIADLGPDVTCDLFFAAEREYWQRKNRAAQVQFARQNRLGLGWANHDHHTYRSSRERFSDLIRALEKLGFKPRERFYAGAEAGWGAQVLEQHNCNITIFADVDMSPEELQGDFSHEGLSEKKELGTVGLWCGLHGEAILQAGMHHLECQFSFDALRDQLAAAHVGMMAPFTSFPFLRQAFTEGERWPVAEKRIQALLKKGQITPAMANHFRMEGAIGSHLENLERNDGFKGFNQHGVSQIIAKTDPRKQAGKQAGKSGANVQPEASEIPTKPTLVGA